MQNRYPIEHKHMTTHFFSLFQEEFQLQSGEDKLV